MVYCKCKKGALRRMREFYRTYENTPEILAEAMTIGWTQNIVILENCVTAGERTRFITAVRRFLRTKTKLLEKISEGMDGNNPPPLRSVEDAEDEHSLYNIDASNITTPKGGARANSSRLASPAVIYWTKQQAQDWRKDGAEDARIPDQRCDRVCLLFGLRRTGKTTLLRQELYDRAKMIHTTFIPYREHSRLLGISQIDVYIRYGGTLRAGQNAEDASFRDDESTRRYIDTAICKNIQHSLACCEDGGRFRHLRPLYEAGELAGAINRIIEDRNLQGPEQPVQGLQAPVRQRGI